MKPTIHLYTVCWDEADMLGFFFRHYDRWVDRYVIYDDGSTDGSIDIIRAHPKAELRTLDRLHADSFTLSHRAMQDGAWKESRGRADWIVVTAIDEHLHVKGTATADYLAAQGALGVTLIPALGFDMNHPTMPEDRGLLTDIVTRGRPRSFFNKLSIFNPNAIWETGFAPGRHSAEPAGNLVLPQRDEMMISHYKHLGFERNATREAAQALRLGSVDVAKGFGRHYLQTKEQLRSFWDEMEAESQDLAGAAFEPDRACVRPLWWRTDLQIKSAGLANSNPTKGRNATPKVSVLVKAFNHAAYVRQTIESVLCQSFQDFEIVVTDDGSTDGTLEILKSFSDPRIRLEASGRNFGISAAMNATIARARGRYLTILNSDDWALPDRLRRQVEFLDANPNVSLVFGLPRCVNERGEPTTQSFNDWHAQLMLADFSRRSWLRQFFFHGNCLCAPTAMVRREAYEAVGLYDSRLTNLQDFDMWIRMLIAGHNIHVLPEELTAFRIRNNNANTGFRPDAKLRSPFETTKVLKRFNDLSSEQFEAVFSPEAATTTIDGPVPLRVAELARQNPRIEYQNFALQYFYESAKDSDQYTRLRELSGSMDALGFQEIMRRDEQQVLTTAQIENLRAQLIDAEAALGNLRAKHLRAGVFSRLLSPPSQRRSLARQLVGSGLLDAAWYSAAYPEVGESGLSAAEHYLEKGFCHGCQPNPLFDTRWYLERYDDVRRSGINPLLHYLNNGAYEGRDPGPGFQTNFYLAANPDVRANGINPLLHYLRYGQHEGRMPIPTM